MVNSRRKGNDGERQILKLFRAWWGGEWTRRSMGYQGSDLMVPLDFPFALEIKFNDDLRVRHLFKPTNFLLNCWGQALEQAEKEARKPMLAAKIEGNWYIFQTLTPITHRPSLEITLDGQVVYVSLIDEFMLSFEDKKAAAKRKSA